MTDAATLPDRCCANCDCGHETVAMLIVRCRNPESPRNGRLVDLDEVCETHRPRKDQTQ